MSYVYPFGYGDFDLYQVQTLTERVYLDQSLDSTTRFAFWFCLAYAFLLSALTARFAFKSIKLNRSSPSGGRSIWSLPKTNAKVRLASLAVSLCLLFIFVVSPLLSIIFKSGFQYEGTHSEPDPLVSNASIPSFSVQRLYIKS